MGAIGFQADNMTIFEDWCSYLLQRKNWLIFNALKYLTLIGLFIWSYKMVKEKKETLAIAWLGASVVYFYSMPAHYYLIGVLPLIAVTAVLTPTMFSGVLWTCIALSAVTSLSETLGWSLASIILVTAMTYGIGFCLTTNKDYKPTFAAIAAFISLFFTMFYQTLLEDPAKKPTARIITPPNSLVAITRSFVTPEGFEVKDTGCMVPHDGVLKLNGITESNKILKIRTDRFYDGTLVLKSSDGTLIHKWDIKRRGWLFDTLSTPFPLDKNKEYLLVWEGPEKTDIGIFSIWVE
jgi:hypothetical protein